MTWSSRYGVGRCTACDRRVTKRYLHVDGHGQPRHAAISNTGDVCDGVVELDQDVELPRHVRAAMDPGQDRIPIRGGQW